MRPAFLDTLICPVCKQSLTLSAFSETSQGDVESGILRCPCEAWYPIIGFVPRMLTGDLRPDYSEFLRSHASKLESMELGATDASDGTRSSVIRTRESFGFEWSEFARFGWEDEETDTIDLGERRSHAQEHLMAHTRLTFHRKTLLTPEQLEGRRVLDVGCGNGRYAHVSARCGAEVIGIDLSRAVDVAAANTRNDPSIQIVQADVFNLPFRESTFDVIYSIGVLHHTPNAHDAFRSLVPKLRPQGTISIHLYHQGNPIWEWVDALLRHLTTRIPLRPLWYGLYALTALGKVAFLNRYSYAAINALVRAQPVHHHNFDWYSAPIASHHNGEEVEGWFREMGLEQLEDDDPLRNPASYYVSLYPKFARTREGSIRPLFCTLYPRWGLTQRGSRPLEATNP